MVQKIIYERKSCFLWFLILFVVGTVAVILVAYAIVPPLIGELRGLREVAHRYEACVAFQEAGEWDKATEECEAVIRLDADYRDVRERLGQIQEQRKAYHYRRGMDAMDAGEWELAVKEFSIVFGLDTRYKDVGEKLEEAKMMIFILTPEPSPTPTFMERVEALPIMESITVPADGTEVSSTMELRRGRRYTIVARGEFRYGYGKTCGAYNRSRFGVGLGIENALIKPDFGDSERHIYVYTWIGSGAKIKFKIFDTIYEDNVGGLVVEIQGGWP